MPQENGLNHYIMFKPSQLLPFFNNINTQHLWLGYSGGLDSHVLLHALVELITTQQFNIALTQLHAIHINHGWSQHASAWDQHCRQVCYDLNVDYRSLTINAKAENGESPEAYAREARYAALTNFINEYDLLLTAHQQDDQAETLLVQLLRGSGIKGLASMPQLTPFAKGWHLRPLLAVTRDDLLAYAKQQQLKWIEDESNANTRYTRNFLRHTILPALKQRWPQVNATLARVAEHCAEAAALLDELAQEDLAKIRGTQPNTLSCSALLQLSESRQKNILRYWFTQLNCEIPSTAQLQHILQDVLNSKEDACPKVVWQHKALRRYQDNLYLTDNIDLHNPDVMYEWDLKTPLFIPPIGTLTAILKPAQGIRADIHQLGKLTIRFRQDGERCHPIGRQGSHPLKKLFQEWQVPPWQRDQIPLLYCDDQLAAVIGYCICEPFANKNSETSWLVEIT